MAKEVILESGKKLSITVAPFGQSRALYQAMLDEAKGVKVMSTTDLDVNFFKDLFCVGLSSKKIEAALDECMKRAVYDGRKIDADTFEPVEARADYLQVCFEVAQENVAPFTSALMRKFSPIVEKLKSSLA